MPGAEGEPSPRDDQKTSLTVLVVEDEVLVRMVIADQLRGAGYKVIEAANAHEAAHVLRSTPVELVISDIRMPGSMDGVGLARLIRAEYPSTKIVLTSGHLSEAGWAQHDGFFH
jgi:two-component system, response regulator PdtaR